MATKEEPRGWYTDRRGVRYVHVPLGERKKMSVRLTTCTNDEQATTWAGVIRQIAKSLRDAGKESYLTKFVEDAATADAERLAAVQRAVTSLVSGTGARPITTKTVGTTWGDVAKRWTTGELSRLYPDQIRKKKSVKMDRSRLKTLAPLIGDMLITDPNWIEHAEGAMRKLPKACKTSGARRQYGQFIRRVLEIAVYPLRLIAANPLPRGFLPKVRQDRALQMPYPDEDATLMGCTHDDLPVVRRLAWGFLARMGVRKSNIIGGVDSEGYEDDTEEEKEPIPPLSWDRVDLVRGVVYFQRSKTSKPVPIPLDAGVARALAAFKKLFPPEYPAAPIFVNAKGNVITLQPKQYHADLKLAGVTRPELFAKTKDSLPVRVHDLRALFVTEALARGKDETWVRDRTLHKTREMIDTYRREARFLAELDLGTLVPLDEAIPELGGPQNASMQTASKAPDESSGEAPDEGPKGAEVLLTTVEIPEEAIPSRHLATQPTLFDSSYEGSNPSVGTSRIFVTSGTVAADRSGRHSRARPGAALRSSSPPFESVAGCSPRGREFEPCAGAEEARRRRAAQVAAAACLPRASAPARKRRPLEAGARTS